MTLPPSFTLSADHRSFRLDPRDPGFFQNPYPVYAELHRHARVAFWKDAGCLAIADHASVQSILKDRRFVRVLPEQVGADRFPAHLPAFAALERHSLLELDGPPHTRLRTRLTRAFVARAIEVLAPGIEQYARELAANLRSAGGGDLVPAFAEPLPVAIIADLIGVPREAAPDLLRWSHAMVAMYRFAPTSQDEADAERASQEFATFLAEALRVRRAAPRNDLLSALIGVGDDALSTEEIVSLVVLLLNAGHEATVHQVGNGLASLLSDGKNLLQAWPTGDDAEPLVEEMLRHDTPLHLFRRTTATDVDLAGVALPRGTEVALLLAAANRDPAVFAEPDRFDPARPRRAHASFGGGVHFCIGAPLARLELQIAFRVLREVIPTLRLASPPLYRDSFHFRGVESLPVTCE